MSTYFLIVRVQKGKKEGMISSRSMCKTHTRVQRVSYSLPKAQSGVSLVGEIWVLKGTNLQAAHNLIS
jgi:hypothetical protein